MVRLSPALLVALGLLIGWTGETARAEPTGDLAEIQTLRKTGGHAVTARLAQLAKSRSEPVRVAALQAITSVGIRTLPVSRALDAAADRDLSVAEETAFFAAIGRVGGEQDMELLVDALKSGDQDLRELAHRSIRGLTNQGFPLEYGRWFQWWRRERPRLRANVRSALRRLPEANETDQVLFRAALAGDGWVDHEHVSTTVAAWLSDGDRTLRSHAFHAIASLRLGAVVAEVESALPYLTDIDGEDGLRAVRALGLNPRLLSPYWRKRLAEGR